MKSDIANLVNLLGQDVLMLPWPKGSKGCKRYWGHLTIDHMSDSKYLAKLGNSTNIGVALGDISSGLCSIDIDLDEMVEPFLEMNPFLKETLCSKGARGCNFWVRITNGPRKSFSLWKGDRKVGEFRGSGNQTIIHGIHPSGTAYQIINEALPVEINFDQLTFPVRTRTERTERTEENRRGSTPVGCENISLQELLFRTQPNRPHNNHHLLFVLARGIKALEVQKGDAFTKSELRAVFNQWYAAALPYVRENLKAEDYFLELLDLYDYTKTPLGAGAVESAFLLAQSNPYPPESEQFEDNEFKLLVALCWQLQQQAGAEPFYLSCRTVQQLFGLETHGPAARRLSGLVRYGVLEEAVKGGSHTNKATRYRYVDF